MKGVINILSLKSDHKRKLLLLSHCAFHKHANSEVQKPYLTIAFFAAVNNNNNINNIYYLVLRKLTYIKGNINSSHISYLREQNLTLMGSKGHGL